MAGTATRVAHSQASRIGKDVHVLGTRRERAEGTMNFNTLFMYAYGLLQLYILCVRKSLRISTLIFLFFVGALSCVSATIVLQSLALHYFGSTASTTALLAVIEEAAKAAPLVYLLFCTRVGQMIGVLDGLLIGAAVGAGFGFAEDAIFTVENARPPDNVATYAGMWNMLFTWLPGGWTANQIWFPGHLVLAALVGWGLTFVRRMMPTRRVWVRATIAAAIFSSVAFLHVGFNVPQAIASGPGYLIYAVVGVGGRYAAIIVFLLVLTALYIEDTLIRPAGGAADTAEDVSRLRSAPLLAQLSAWIGALDRGWSYARAASALERLRRQLANLQWERRFQPDEKNESVIANLRARTIAEAAELERLSGERPPLPSLSSVSLPKLLALAGRLLTGAGRHLAPALTASWQKTGLRHLWRERRQAGAILFDLGFLIVALYGFWLVFLSSFMVHTGAVAIANTGIPFAIAVLGQVLIIWQSVAFLRRARAVTEPLDVADAIVARCQTILAWTGVLSCSVALKSLYDLRSFPYPFRPAELLSNWNQYQSCYGPAGATSGTGPATSPIIPLTHEHASGAKPDAGL